MRHSFNFFHKHLFCGVSGLNDQETQENNVHQKILSKVKALPDAVVKECECFCEIKPGVSKNGEYKNPEYHLYNKWSFYEAHKELGKYRMEQPSVFNELTEKKRE